MKRRSNEVRKVSEVKVITSDVCLSYQELELVLLVT